MPIQVDGPISLPKIPVAAVVLAVVVLIGFVAAIRLRALLLLLILIAAGCGYWLAMK